MAGAPLAPTATEAQQPRRTAAGAGPRLTHMPALDGLRGIAVAAVVAYHLGFLSGGFLGVDVFFVLSGFLVTSLLLAETERTDRISLRRFWLRRFRRLAPAVLVVVPVTLLGALAVGWPDDELRGLGWDGFATLTWWANWRQVGGQSYWAGDPSPFRHAWSLSVEEQFYLLWPLVVVAAGWLARRRGRSVRRAVGVTALMGVAAGATWMTVLAGRDGTDLSRVYVGTDTRLFTPLVGCVLACWWTARRREGWASGRGPLVGRILAIGGMAVLVVMAVTVTVSDPDLYQRGGFLLAAAAAGAVLVGVTVPAQGAPDPVGIATVHPVTRYLGTRSYGIYLWSWPLQVLIGVQWDGLGRGALALVVVPLTLVIAEASYRWVEDPIRRGRSWAARPVARRPAWAAGVGLAALALALVGSQAVPPPVHETLDPVEQAQDVASRPPPTTAVTTAPATAPTTDDGRGAADHAATTAPPPPPEDLRIMITGDSVAFTAGYYAPHGDALPDGIASVDTRGLIGCPLLSGDGWAFPNEQTGEFTTGQGGGDCKLQFESEATGLTGSPHVVLAMPGAWEYTSARRPDGHVVEAQSPEMHDALVSALVERARRADDAGAAFALLAWACPGPESGQERRDRDYIAWINQVMRDAAAAAEAEGVRATVIGPNAEVCVGADALGEPTPARNKATDDEVHVRTAEGGQWLWDVWLGPALTTWTGR